MYAYVYLKENRQRGIMQEGLDILNRGGESVARSQRIAAETGMIMIIQCINLLFIAQHFEC